MNKISLNSKSYYNFLESTLSINDIINYSIKNNLNFACLIDKNLFGAVEFINQCNNNNLKPILGLEINYRDEIIYIIAKNVLGYKQLTKISSFQNLNMDFDLLLNNENIFIISKSLLNINNENNFLYIPGFDNSICFETSFLFDENDIELFKILYCIKNEILLKNYDYEIEFKQFCLNIQSNIKWNENEKNNLKKLIDNISNYNLTFENNFVNFKSETSKDKYLWELAKNGLIKKTNNFLNIDKEKYLQRLKAEFELIKSKNFIDYFLLVQDLINYAKNNKIIIGPGRGSVGGSLIAFALNITEIDPIKYNLLFERFLNDSRISMPDIDIDIMDNKRQNLVNYLNEKYGKYNVAHIITFSKYKIKLAIRDVGRVMQIPLSFINNICKFINIKNENDIDGLIKSNNDFKQLYNSNIKLFDLANKLLSFPRQYSIHAAGVVVSQQELWNIIGVLKNSDDILITQTSMEYLEQLGLIKLDLLGLRNLTIIDNILKLIYACKDKVIDLNAIDLQDKNIFNEIFCKAKTNGIFQFESPGMKKVLIDIQPQCLEDLSIASSIFRPGAFKNINIFLKNKKNNCFETIHPSISNILKDTYGTIVYQEQIIQIVQKVANFNKTESDLFRKAISKKDEKIINSLKQEFINKAIKNNYSIKTANEIFNFMQNFASYGFNHSHAVAYALISYYLAYLKYYYPLETITILLSNNYDKESLKNYKNEANELNTEFCLPNILISSTNFVLIKNKIYFSFNSIDGIGNEITNKIILLRKTKPDIFDSPIKIINFLNKNSINKKQIENLIKVGCFDDFKIRREILLHNLEKIIKTDLLIIENNKLVFDFNLDTNIEINDDNYIKWENDLLGIAIYRVETEYQKIFKKFQNKYSLKSKIDKNDEITNTILVQFISQEIKSNKNTTMNIIKCLFDNKELKIYDFDFNETKNKFKANKFYIIDVKNFKNNQRNSVILKRIKEEVI